MYKWQPFFWGFGRNGQLLPLLLSFIKDPTLSLYLHGAASVAMGLGSFFALARFIGPRAVYPLVGAAAAVLFLLLADNPMVSRYFAIGHPYGKPMCLMFVGLCLALNERLLSPTRVRAVGLLLVVLAVWCNPSLPLLVVPMVGIRTLTRARVATASQARAPITSFQLLSRAVRSPTAFTIGVMLLAMPTIMWAGSHWAVGGSADRSIIPLAQWPSAWVRLGKATITGMGGIPLAIGAMVAVALLAMSIQRSWKIWFGVAQSTTMVAAGCAVFLMGLALNAHIYVVMAKISQAKWTVPIDVIVLCWASSILIMSVARWVPRGLLTALPLNVAAWALVLAGVMWRWGLPAPAELAGKLDARYGQFTERILASGATHIIGRNREANKAMFHVNLTLARQGETRMVWAISGVARATRDLWFDAGFSQAVLVGVGPRAQIQTEARKQGLPPLTQVSEVGGLPVFRIADASDAGTRAVATDHPATSGTVEEDINDSDSE